VIKQLKINETYQTRQHWNMLQ